jgi:hypothetical protein
MTRKRVENRNVRPAAAGGQAAPARLALLSGAVRTVSSPSIRRPQLKELIPILPTFVSGLLGECPSVAPTIGQPSG